MFWLDSLVKTLNYRDIVIFNEIWRMTATFSPIFCDSNIFMWTMCTVSEVSILYCFFYRFSKICITTAIHDFIVLTIYYLFKSELFTRSWSRCIVKWNWHDLRITCSLQQLIHTCIHAYIHTYIHSKEEKE